MSNRVPIIKFLIYTFGLVIFCHYVFLLTSRNTQANQVAVASSTGNHQKRPELPQPEVASEESVVRKIQAESQFSLNNSAIVDANLQYNDKKEDSLALKKLVRGLIGYRHRMDRSVEQDFSELSGALASHLRPELKELYASYYLRSIPDSEQMLEVIRNMKPTNLLSDHVIGECCALIANNQPSEATKLLDKFPWSDEYAETYSRSFLKLGLRNFTETSELLVRMKGAPAYDWAIAGFVHAIRVDEPESTRIWKEQIKNPKALEIANSRTIEFPTRR